MARRFTDTMATETMIAIHELRSERGYMPTKRELADRLRLSYCAIQNRLKNSKLLD